MKTMAITGASGCIGQALLGCVQGRYHVRALFRAETDLSRRWRGRGCEVVQGSLADPAAVARLVTGADVVVHCAATMEKGSYDRSYEVNVQGTRRVAEAARAAGCRVFVHLSSISVFAATRTPGNVITEEDEPAHFDQLNAYGQTKLPFGLRCSGAEGFKLSPCYERDVLWITLFSRNKPGLAFGLAELLAEHHSRFHWGKHVPLPAAYVRVQYPAWDAVVRLKRELDPEGLFSDALTRQFFALEEPARGQEAGWMAAAWRGSGTYRGAAPRQRGR
jgi:hypothetical protein